MLKRNVGKCLTKFAKYSGIVLGKAARLKLISHKSKFTISKLLGKITLLPNSLYQLVYPLAYEFIKNMYFLYGSPVIIEKNITCNCTMRLDITQKTQRTIFLSEIYEPLISKYITSQLKQGDWFVDVGANVGWYTLISAKIVGNTGKVIAFEPEKTNFRSLTLNVKMNNLKNVLCINKALSDTQGHSKLFTNPLNEGGGSLKKHDVYADGPEIWSIDKVKRRFPDAQLEQDTQTTTLDKVAEDFTGFSSVNHNCIIKIDVEGCELEVLEGMKKLLHNTNPKVICEISNDQEKTIRLMEELEYKAYKLGENGHPLVCNHVTIPPQGIMVIFQKSDKNIIDNNIKEKR